MLWDAKLVVGHAIQLARLRFLADLEAEANFIVNGLLRPSFIPPRHIRELRELTRYRESLVREQTSLANRIQKLVESGNVKLGQVLTRWE